MNPHVTFRDYLGKRIFSIETPAGFVHVVASEIFAHSSEATASIRGEENPVLKAMENEIQVSGEVTVEE